jgi:hypothetical protein
MSSVQGEGKDHQPFSTPVSKKTFSTRSLHPNNIKGSLMIYLFFAFFAYPSLA